ncbi:hypothetical protein [Bradyrhizobium sp.]|uniref:hypothetical protein n=1 Tax=Bradyrhizobium sp. TaxID=376 RepID=UPI0025BFC59C|nr:hypothetical protein [Bradyrhizobium sp.]MBV8922161.1 hypothetical protein [Bradyrhizobium sp.]
MLALAGPAQAPSISFNAGAVGLDPHNWKFVRVLLSEDEPGASARGTAHQIAHLSCPLLDTLPPGGRG